MSTRDVNSDSMIEELQKISMSDLVDDTFFDFVEVVKGEREVACLKQIRATGNKMKVAERSIEYDATRLHNQYDLFMSGVQKARESDTDAEHRKVFQHYYGETLKALGPVMADYRAELNNSELTAVQREKMARSQKKKTISLAKIEAARRASMHDFERNDRQLDLAVARVNYTERLEKQLSELGSNLDRCWGVG